MDVERVTRAAQRRRERRLRAWQRHARMTVQLALAEKLHHSANKVEPHNAPRGQEKRAGRDEAELETHSGPRAPTPLPLAPLSEVSGPQRSDRTVRRSVWDAPLLVMPTPMRSAWDGVDSATVSFLFKMALEKEEEEETKRERVKRQITKRQRKKMRKKKLPKSSSSRAARTREPGRFSSRPSSGTCSLSASCLCPACFESGWPRIRGGFSG